jgi:hypothetical protein
VVVVISVCVEERGCVEDRVTFKGCCDFEAVRRERRGKGVGEGGAMFVARLALDEVVEIEVARLKVGGRRSRGMVFAGVLVGDGDGVRVPVFATRAYG